MDVRYKVARLKNASLTIEDILNEKDYIKIERMTN